MINKDLNIAVLCGGLSCEREISLRSGTNVFESLKRSGYHKSFLFDIDSIDSLAKLTDLKKKSKIDAAILMTHGKYGEDGCLQGFLELLQIPYSGSKVKASANCMNKITSKEILFANQLPVLPFCLVSLLEDTAEDLERFGFSKQEPIIVKPIDEGSSVGILKFDNFEQFKNLHQKNWQGEFANHFIEQFIQGIELTASIMPKGSELIVLPLLELRPKNSFYDYEAKYTKGMTEFVLPAAIPDDITLEVQECTIGAYTALDCEGFARVDFMISKGDEYRLYILELNTLPGMTNTSDLPAKAKAAGIEYDELVELFLVDTLNTSSICEKV